MITLQQIAAELRALANRLIVDPQAQSYIRIVEWDTKTEQMPAATVAAGWRVRIESGPTGFTPVQQDVAEASRSATFTLSLAGNYVASVQRLNSAATPIGAKASSTFSIAGETMIDILVPNTVNVRSGDTPSANRPPQWTASSVNPRLAPGESFDFRTVASDPDGDPLTFSPQGGEAALQGKATLTPDGILTATEDLGTADFVVVADDGK